MELEHTVKISLLVTDETDPEIDEEFIVSVSFRGDLIQRVTLEPKDALVAIFEVNGQSILYDSVFLMYKRIRYSVISV